MLFANAVFNVFTHLVFLTLQMAFNMLSIMFAKNYVTVFSFTDAFHYSMQIMSFCINNSVLFLHIVPYGVNLFKLQFYYLSFKFFQIQVFVEHIQYGLAWVINYTQFSCTNKMYATLWHCTELQSWCLDSLHFCQHNYGLSVHLPIPTLNSMLMLIHPK